MARRQQRVLYSYFLDPQLGLIHIRLTTWFPFTRIRTTRSSPAVTTTVELLIAPLSPAASAKGTVRPSDMPMTTSRTISLDVK